MMARIAVLSALALAIAVPAGAGTIEKRERRQEHRIHAGEKSGKLSPEEAQRLENKEAGLRKEEQAMRDANGGKLSHADRRALRHQENKDAHAIYRQKHDDNDR